jgi:hypothetical protein
MRARLALSLLLLALGGPALAGDAATVPAQPPAAARPWHLELTIRDVGLGLGDSPRIIGVRLNYRDRAPYRVYGLAATIWSPREHPSPGAVDGVLLGLPVAVAGDVRGLGLGIGVGAERSFDGLGLGLLGVGAGGRLRGIHLSAVGVGAGGALDGLGFGLVGVGAGDRIRGIAIGGLGAGAGGDVTGVVLGGLGAGAGGRIRGLAVGGLGVGSGKAIEGIALSIGGVGAPSVRGLAVALGVGGRDVKGIAIAPAYLYVERGGALTGVAVSAFNRVLGEQRGLTIGIVNYAASLSGVQLGLLNYAGNNRPGLRLLPLANVHL